MKRSVGALDSCASSTSRMIRDIVLSSASAVTETRIAASWLMVPANTSSSGPFLFGTDSPVTGDSSTDVSPERMVPSAGIRSPGRTRMVVPAESCSAGTSVVLPSFSTNAVLGTSIASARIEARARPAATPSSNSPTRNRNTTAAASSLASMNTAPTAAIVMSVSMVKGIPMRAAATARLAIGIRPTAMARINTHGSVCGNTWASTNAAPSATPQTMVSRALGDAHQGPSAPP